MTQTPQSEIVSFNEAVPELSTLLEIDGAQLDEVIGGKESCPQLQSCGTFNSCGTRCSVDVAY